MCFATITSSQNTVFKGDLVASKANGTLARVSSNVLASLNGAFTNYELYALNGKAIEEFAKNKNYVDFRLELGANHVFDMSLELNDMRSWNHRAVKLTDVGEVVMPRTPAVTYKGWANHSAEQQIRVSIYNEAISGYIMQDGIELFIEPVSQYIKEAESNLFMAYRSSDVILKSPMACGVIELAKAEENIKIKRASSSSPCLDAGIALACDKVFTNMAGSATAASTVMKNLLNWMEGKFMDPGILISFSLVSEYIVDPTGTDPWDPTMDGYTLMPSFRDWGNAGGFGTTDYVLAHLWTRRNITSPTSGAALQGLSYTGLICVDINPYYGYGIMEHNGGIGNAQNYIVETHECGHMWNAAHTGSSSINIMAPAVGTSNTQWDATSISSIAAFKDSRTCLTSTCTFTGINEKKSFNSSVIVAPNPSTGNINLSFDQGEKENLNLEIRNVIGQLIYSESLDNFYGKFSNDFDLNKYGKGLYFLTIKGIHTNVSNKIVIQ